MCIELLLLAGETRISSPFRAISRDPSGQVFVFILTVAAAEAAIGLAPSSSCPGNRATIDVTDID
ncbi:MAG: hypothetical protein IPH43_02300 [Xanthomonadales bacterium]|nr:hypothetical protein [Xanthomonadales bacterium]